MRFNTDELICSAATIGGIGAKISLDERIAAAAAGGFKAIGLSERHYEAAIADGTRDDEIQAILDRHGVRCLEIEGLYSWAATGDGPGVPGLGKIDWRERLQVLLHMADVFGARHMTCGEVGFYGPLLGIGEVADRYGEICDQAAEHELLCVLEPVAWGEIPDPAVAWEVVRRANRDNGGLVIDTWHYFRGAADPRQLRAIPGEAIRVIQLNDGRAMNGSLLEETTKNRLVPGHGTFDLTGFLSLLDEIGASPAVSVEIMSEELTRLPLADQAGRARDGALAVIGATGLAAGSPQQFNAPARRRTRRR